VIGNEWLFWTFSAATAVTLLAGVVATRVRREWLTSLPMTHVAALVLLALFGWESLIYLPGVIQTYVIGVAGIADPPNVEGYQAFMVASVAFVIAAALAIYGILRSRPWGVVLGIGVAGTRLVTALVSTANLFTLNGDFFGPDAVGWNAAIFLAERAIPAIAAIVLLMWPLLRGSRRETPPVEAVDWHVDPTPEAGR
jgi:hypothetical protein